MDEYAGIMEYLELSVTRCGRWTGNREFIWSGLNPEPVYTIGPPLIIVPATEGTPLTPPLRQ